MLTHKFIEMPLCSAEQPATIIRELIAEWVKFKKTPKYQQAVDMSAERQVKTQRLGSSIYHAQKAYSRGRAMAFQVFRDDLQFDTLDGMQQQLVEDFNTNAPL